VASRIGSWLRGKYHLDRELGEGGMAVVYEATHRNKKRFAVKMLRPELSTVSDIRKRFLREGYVANSVDHPGVVAVLDDDVTEDGCAFLVMELLDGESVERIAARNGDKLPVPAVLAIAHGLCDVLVAAHAKNVVHRDLKPANLFVTRSGGIKVLDFGIARIRDAQMSTATNTGMPMGTPAFMGPEQARGKSSLMGPKSDLWAVGATMFTLMTGELVHSGETSQEMVYLAASEPARSLAKPMPSAPAEVVAIVDRALAFKPEDRFEDAAAMRDAIARAFEALYGKKISAEPATELVRTATATTISATNDIESAPTVAMAAVGRTTAQPSSMDLQAPLKSRKPLLLVALGGAGVLAAIAIGVVATSGPQTQSVASHASVESTAAPAASSAAISTSVASVMASEVPPPPPSPAIVTAAKPPITVRPKPSTSAPRVRDSDFDRR
jgi:serine/threonine-protein kinase